MVSNWEEYRKSTSQDYGFSLCGAIGAIIVIAVIFITLATLGNNVFIFGGFYPTEFDPELVIGIIDELALVLTGLLIVVAISWTYHRRIRTAHVSA
jgi:hypothetical protein